MPPLHQPVRQRPIPAIPRIARRVRIGAVAVAILLAWHSIASAQSPAYTTRPRSNGGRAAGFGTMSPGRGPSRPATGGGQAPRSGAMNAPAGGGATAPRAGASRPAIGSRAPSVPFKGSGTSAGASTRRASGGGMQVFSADQLKAGQGQPVGTSRGRR